MEVATGNHVDLCRTFPFKEWTRANMALSHDFRKFLNAKMMDAIKGDDSLFIGETRSALTQDCTLTRNMPLVGCDTDRNHGLYNAEMYTLIDWHDSNDPQNPTLIIRELYDESADEIMIPLNDFHSWLRPGFCVTIDSSQGRTIREKYTVWQAHHPFMTRSRRYVAVSRATRKQDVQVVNCSLADLMDEMTRIPVKFH